MWVSLCRAGGSISCESTAPATFCVSTESGECFVTEQAAPTRPATHSERMHQNTLTDTYLAAFEASGIRPSEFHAAVQPVTVGTNMEVRCLTRPGFLEREQVQRLGTD